MCALGLTVCTIYSGSSRILKDVLSYVNACGNITKNVAYGSANLSDSK